MKIVFPQALTIFSLKLNFSLVSLVSIRTIREDCGEEELSRCARPLQLFQATNDLSFAPKREELDKLCPEFNNGLRCIGSYTRRCMTQIQRDQFNKIYRGTNELIEDLCREGEYQNEFLKHSPCLQTVRPLHIKCADRYQQTMSSIFKASANQTAHNQQEQHSVSGEDDAGNVKIVCWWVFSYSARRASLFDVNSCFRKKHLHFNFSVRLKSTWIVQNMLHVELAVVRRGTSFGTFSIECPILSCRIFVKSTPKERITVRASFPRQLNVLRQHFHWFGLLFLLPSPVDELVETNGKLCSERE